MEENRKEGCPMTPTCCNVTGKYSLMNSLVDKVQLNSKELTEMAYWWITQNNLKIIWSFIQHPKCCWNMGNKCGWEKQALVFTLFHK